MTEAYRSLESTIRKMKSGATELRDVDESVSVVSKSLIEAARIIVEADNKDDKRVKKTDSENDSDDADDTDDEGAEGDDRKEENDDEDEDPQDKMTKTGKTKTDVDPKTHDDRSSDDDNTDETKKSNKARNAENKKIGVKESIAPSVAATLGALSAQARSWTLDEGYMKIETGEPERRTPAQTRAGRHISGLLGSRHVDVLHHPKGGLVIRSKKFGHAGNGTHLRDMSKTLDSHSIPHRYEEHPVRRHGDQLYVLSDHAHELGNRLVGRQVKEGVDQLDELSKYALGHYINTALHSRTLHGMEKINSISDIHGQKPKDREKAIKNHDKKMENRANGVKMAVKKLTREDIEKMAEEELLWIAENITQEEFERLDELSRDTLSGYVKKAKEQGGEDVRRYRRTLNSKHIDHFMKRSRGVDRAEARLSKEEEERISELASQIDELSKKTLGSYIKKANKDTLVHSFKAADSAKEKNYDQELSRVAKRTKGVGKAVDKLTKEEVEETYHGIDEKHIGFAKLKGELSHEKGVKDPGALAASIGMKKYGKKSFEKHAHAGVKEEVEKKLAEEKDPTAKPSRSVDRAVDRIAREARGLDQVFGKLD